MQKTAMDGLFCRALVRNIVSAFYSGVPAFASRKSDWGATWLPAQMLRVMRMLTFLLFATCLSAAASGTAQSVTISGKAMTYKQVFAAVKKQTGYVVLYDPELFADDKTISLASKGLLLPSFLDLILKEQPFNYKIEDRTIFIFPKPGASLPAGISDRQFNMRSFPLAPKLIDIKWKLVNAKGEPVAGATIRLREQKNIFFSNAAGEFSISGIDENTVLIISSVGYETKEVNVSGRTVNTVKLENWAAELSEINVVSTGYQTIPKERATGSFVLMDSAILNRRVSVDLLSRLEGVVSGLVFDKNADNPLGISIRSRATIFSTTQPLIVVDNFPFSGNLNSINPNDVETVTILKDAAASSIWGAFSGNGVIVITTKKGKYNQALKLDINSSIMITDKPDLFYDQQFLGANEFVDVEKYLFDKGFYNRDLTSTLRPVVSPAVEILAQLRAGTLNQAQTDAQLQALKAFDIRNDYDRYFYQNATGQQYAINLSGGSAKAFYYFSVGYNKDLATVVRNKSDRLSLNSSATFQPVRQLEITTGITYAQSTVGNNGMNNVVSGGKFGANTYPYARLADDAGNPLSIIKDFRGSFTANPPVQGLLDWRYFPLNELELTDNTAKGFDTRLFTSLKYKIINGLNVEGSYQYLKSSAEGRLYQSPQSYYMRDLINRYSVISGGVVTARNIPLGGQLINSFNDLISKSYRGQLSYTRSFDKHTVSAIAGAEVLENVTNGYRTGVYGYDINTGASVTLNYTTRYTLYPSGAGFINDLSKVNAVTTNRYRSYYANASYQFNNKYTISASVRRDQSNLFGVKTNQKTVPLWSAGAKWYIDKEEFYTINWLSALKLRGTYGLNGNVNKTITAFTTARGGNVNDNNVPYFEITSPGNPELRWEKSKMLNLAVDFAMKGNAINGSIEYYKKKGVDLIGDAFIPSSTGFLQSRGNYSKVNGQGFDITLNFNAGRKNLRWQGQLLFSHAKETITRNESMIGKIAGYPVNGIYAYKWGGLDVNGDPLGYLDGQLTKDYGEISARASLQIGDGYIYKGSINPRYFGGFRNTVSYKAISLSANIIFKAGHYFRRSSIQYSSLYNSSVGHADFNQRWQKPGDELITNVPAMVYLTYPQFTNRDGFYTNSEILIEKSDFIRFQDINISYGLDKATSKWLPVSSLQFYFYANNLGLIWKANKRGIDPDYRVSYPNPRSWSLGFRASL